MNKKKIWFVTGASKGLGLTLIQKLLATGYKVAATSRTIDSLIEAVGTTATSSNFLPLQVSLTDEQSVKQAVNTTLETFGGIDVVVNNAGYGQFGTLEELSDEEARQNFDINVFGSLNVIRHAMPHLRAQRSGNIFNIASIGGFNGNFAGWGIYCSTKFAVAGFTEALAAEGKPFGINATVVYPGYFRTSFLSEESMRVANNPIAEYEEASASLHLHQNTIDGNQAGDPEKAAEVLIKVASDNNPPVHLFLGQDAYDMAGVKTNAIQHDLENWKELTVSTGF